MNEIAAEFPGAKRCPHCPDQGWYPDYHPNTGDPVQIQCEFCYTTPDSLFNATALALELADEAARSDIECHCQQVYLNVDKEGAYHYWDTVTFEDGDREWVVRALRYLSTRKGLIAQHPKKPHLIRFLRVAK